MTNQTELKSDTVIKSEITVQLLDDGRISLCKRLDSDPMGHALGMSFKPSSNEDIGNAVAEMLESE